MIDDREKPDLPRGCSYFTRERRELGRSAPGRREIDDRDLRPV
jgi:hypothetical protein